MKRIVLTLIFICSILTLLAQPAQNNELPFYYFGKEKILLKNSTQKIFVRVAASGITDFKNFLKSNYQLTDKNIHSLASDQVMVVDIGSSDEAQIKRIIKEIKSTAGIEIARPALVAWDGKSEVINEGFYVKLKPGISFLDFSAFVTQKNCIINKRYKYDNRTYILKAGAANQYDGLGMANAFYESGLFEYAEPDFQLLGGLGMGAGKSTENAAPASGKPKISPSKLNSIPNDPLFNLQWAAKNDGTPAQNNGTVGADIDLDEAWDITQGSTTIRVAVIDEGVQRDHPDLINNIDPLGFGLTPTNASTGSPLYNDLSHGTSCAGIIAAERNNNIGIAGIAPLCKIIPVNVTVNSGGDYGNKSQLAQCLDWAWDNGGADVLSNSWGGGSPSSMVHDAIIRAVTLGRNGKGAMVVFSTGNNDAGVASPGIYSETIGVGAMSMCDQRKTGNSCDGEYWWGGNYGTGLDISAPGVKIPTTCITGQGDAPDVDYNLTFNGTSSACPMVSGVAALVLSINPNFTQSQAREIIEKSARKVPGFSYNHTEFQPNGLWSSEIGYGMVNAKSAVLLAQNPSGLCRVKVDRPYTLQACSGGNIVLSISNANAGDTYQWRKDGAVVGSGTSISANQTGDYDVVLTTAGGCKDTSSKYAVLISTPDGPLVADAGPDTTIAQGDKIFLGGGPAGHGGTGILHPMRGLTSDLGNNYFYRFDINQPSGRYKVIDSVHVSNIPATDFFCGAAVTPYGLYMLGYNDGDLYKIDTATGQSFRVGVPNSSSIYLTGMCYDPTTDKIFAIGSNATYFNYLYEINRKNSILTNIAPITGTEVNTNYIIGLAVDNSGQLFGHKIEMTSGISSDIVKIDKTTGAGTIVGPTGFHANYAQDIAIDPLTNECYLTGYTTTINSSSARGSGLWQVNKTSGNTKLIGSIGEPYNRCDALAFANKEYKYQWSPATNLSNPNDANPEFSAVNGIYNYTLTITDLCGNTATDQVIVNVGGIIPVTLVNFSGNLQNNVALLKWTVENEINFHKYVVERSTNGHNFESISEVTATNTSGTAYYQYPDDKLPQTEYIYYRLRMVDLDGHYRNSEIIKLRRENIKQNHLISVRPNPFETDLRVEFESTRNDNIQLSLTDSRGSTIQKQNIKINLGVNQLHLRLPSLPAGVYYLKLQTEDYTTTQRIIKL